MDLRRRTCFAGPLRKRATRVYGERPSGLQPCQLPGVPCPRVQGSALIKLATKVPVSPSMRIVFNLLPAPVSTCTLLTGTLRLVASSRTSASLALPFSGTARTRACSTELPSASCTMPSTSSRELLGVSRTWSKSASSRTVQGLFTGARLKDVWINILPDDTLEEEYPKQQDDGRNI